MKNTGRFSSIIILFLVILTFSVQGQENAVKPRIAVKQLTVTDPENVQLKVISDRVTGSTELVLKFMNQYELETSEEIAGIDDTAGSMLDYCNSKNIDNLVYGKTYIGSDYSFVIEMSVFSREKEQTVLTKIGRAETALDIFEASDSLTAAIIEEFSGMHIAFGKIHLENTGVEGSFFPYIDGEPFNKDSANIDNLLIGKRTVEIRQVRMTGETVIHTEEVIIRENSITDVSFEIPHLLPAETEIIKDYDKIIEKNWDRLKRKDKVARAFNELDSIFTNADYNLTLLELREKYRNRRAEWEANLVELSKQGTREFIIGAAMGVNIGDITKRNYDDENTKEDSPYDPIDEYKWNDEKHPSPVFGVNIQYQLFRNLYLQTEFNYKEIFYQKGTDFDNYIKIMEIPVLLKLTKQFNNHRLSMYMGPGFFKVDKAGGLFDYKFDPADFTHVDVRDQDIEMIMGLEYGYKKGRHVLTAGLRYTNMNILEYSFFDVDDGKDYDQMLASSTFELLLGYGYNLGGSGEIVKEEDKDKWLFPAETGLMFSLRDEEDNTQIYAGGGALRKIAGNFYGGLKLVVFQEGGAPMLSVAHTKDPDKLIHNYSVLVFPMFDMLVGAFHYSIAINRFSLSAFAGGPLEKITDMGIGIGAGYFF